MLGFMYVPQGTQHSGALADRVYPDMPPGGQGNSTYYTKNMVLKIQFPDKFDCCR